MPNKDYYFVRGVPDVECLNDGLEDTENFNINPKKTNGLHMFDIYADYRNMRVIDEELKQHLEKQELKGVYFIQTAKYSGRLMLQLEMG